MNCKSCGSENLSKFRAEISIRFPELKDIIKPAVMVFPELLICLDCGIAQFAVPKTDWEELRNATRLHRDEQSYIATSIVSDHVFFLSALSHCSVMEVL